MIINWGDAPFKAFITVTYPSGTCTVSGNGQTYTHTGGGTTTFTVKKKGTYTVKSESGTNTASKSVNITSRNQTVSVALIYTFYIFKSGTGMASGFSVKADTTSYGDTLPTVSASEISFYGSYDDSGNGSFYVTPSMDVSVYTKICFDIELTYNYGGKYGTKLGIDEDNDLTLGSGAYYTAVSHLDAGAKSRQVVTVPFNKGITTKQFVKVISNYSAGSIYNIWLES